MLRTRFEVSVGIALLATGISVGHAQMPGYPAPRYPKVPKITTVEQLMPNARHVVTRVGNGVMRPGFGVKGGEKVLLFFGGYAQSNTDPLVIEALARAIREKNGKVDIVILQSAQPDASRMWDPEISSEVSAGVATGADLGDRSVYGSGEGPPWLIELSKQYDLVPGLDELVNGRRNMWPTREALASPEIHYPEEILSAIDQKGWALIIQAKRVHLTDPQGTDVTFTYWPEYWQVVEGKHPTVKTRGGGPGTLRGEGYVYGRPGASEHALIPGHLRATRRESCWTSPTGTEWSSAPKAIGGSFRLSR